MPAPTTTDELLELVRKSGVQDDKRLDAYLDKLRAASNFPAEPNKLASLMVRDGLLTHFQAENLMLGKWRRFNIGKYKVLERLGSGGMGSVYLCEHKLMRRRVAVKVLPTAKAEDPSSLERFYREARAVAALDHPNIVRAYDIDQDENLHFLVMEYVDGASFQEVIKRAGPLDVNRACHYVRQAAHGLQHAHESAGLVHRDIKPGNILVDRNGVVKILDMGLARFFHDEEDILTKKYDENVLGTADYLAPEQALDSHGVDIRADIYSLGATFYFCLTGRTPFSEGTVAQKLIWHQTRQPKSIRSIRPEVPEGVAAIVEKMMAKEASQRYQTPQEVMDALVPWVQTPIAPPPAEEMPRLCPAAMGATPSESNASAPPAATAGMPSPSPRKSWQVSTTPGSRAPGAGTGGSRPVSGSKAPPSGGRDSGSGPAAPPAPNAQKAAAATAVADVQPTQLGGPNGKPIPTPATTDNGAQGTEESVAWERLAPDTEEPSAKADTDPKATRKMPTTSGLRPTLAEYQAQQRMRLLLVGGGVAALILVSLIVILVIIFSGSKPTTEETGGPPPPLSVLYVSRTKEGAIRSLHEALRRAKQGNRIVVLDGPIDGNAADQFNSRIVPKDITLEAEPGATVVWRLRRGAAQAPTLLALMQLDGFCLRGFTFDGESRVQDLIQISGSCPGLKLENLKFQGFERRAISIGNVAGTADRPVLLSNLDFRSAKDVETAIYFDAGKNIIGIKANRHIIVSDVKFEGNFKNKTLKARPDVNEPSVKLPSP
jgi:serine/threonine protein kinase